MPITVRYIGPEAAVLAGTFILTGETRGVTAAQLAAAEEFHPGEFELVGGLWPAMPITLELAAPKQASSEPESIILDEPAPDPAILDEPAAPEQALILDEPAPAAREAQRPAAVRRGRH